MTLQQRRWKAAYWVQVYTYGVEMNIRVATHRLLASIRACVPSIGGRVHGIVAGCGCTNTSIHGCESCRNRKTDCACHEWHEAEEEARFAEYAKAEAATPYYCNTCNWRGTWADCGRGGGGDPYTECPKCGDDDTCFVVKTEGKTWKIWKPRAKA